MSLDRLTNNEARIAKLDGRVGGVYKRVSEVERRLLLEVERSKEADTEIKELITALRETLLMVADKNHITEFFKKNWKYIALWVTITSGGDVKALLQQIGPIVGQ